MPKMDLSKYGIKGVKEVLYNPSYEVLYNEETMRFFTTRRPSPAWKVSTRVRSPNWVLST